LPENDSELNANQAAWLAKLNDESIIVDSPQEIYKDRFITLIKAAAARGKKEISMTVDLDSFEYRFKKDIVKNLAEILRLKNFNVKYTIKDDYDYDNMIFHVSWGKFKPKTIVKPQTRKEKMVNVAQIGFIAFCLSFAFIGIPLWLF